MTPTTSTPARKLDLNANALTVLERRYLVKDDHGKAAESPEDLFWRVARNVAAPDRAYGASDRAVESLAETFFELMATRVRSEEHTSELQSHSDLVCRLLLEKKKRTKTGERHNAR